METESSNDSNGRSPHEENGFVLRPVSVDESGEGLPYAPANWPNRGDNWTWRVGKRVTTTGYYLDRYIYLPPRLCQLECSTRRKLGFKSKLSLEKYIQTTFPGADVDAFFASFSWKIPARKTSSTDGILGRRISFPLPFDEKIEPSISDSQSDTVGCKARNKNCGSLPEATNPSLLDVMPCDICCSEPNFCRACCCILCCKTINSTSGGYSYVKCEAVVDEYSICGHIAHLDCALRSYMAGTVGGCIGLDAEYYCRRCDARTDLVSHVRRSLQACESIDSRDDIEKILGVGMRILRGSHKNSAQQLLSHIELVIAKLKSGTYLEDIWKVDGNVSAICTVKNEHDPPSTIMSSEWKMSIHFDHQTESLKIEDEVDQVLQALRKSQEFEYKLAEERLYAQKNYLLNLYQQLDKERAELARRTSSNDRETLLNVVLNRVDQIKRQVNKLKQMEKVANGFGNTPKGILKEEFGLDVED